MMENPYSLKVDYKTVGLFRALKYIFTLGKVRVITTGDSYH